MLRAAWLLFGGASHCRVESAGGRTGTRHSSQGKKKHKLAAATILKKEAMGNSTASRVTAAGL